MLPVVSADLDGNGIWDDNDRFGMVGYQDVVPIAMIGAGIRFTTKNADDIPEITFMSERTIRVWEQLTEFLFDETIYWSWSRTGMGNERSRQMFANNQALFNWNEFHSIPRLRAMETDFGILPMPLFDETQGRFFHHVNPHVAPMFSIPLSNPNIEETGAISDHLAVLGRQIMTPAYYEISLQGQHARDEESIMTMDLIFSSLTFDTGYMNNWGDLGSFTMHMYHNRQSDIVSEYERRVNVAQRQLDRMIDNFLDH